MTNENRYFTGYLYLAAFALMSWWLVKLTGVDEITDTKAPAHSADYFSNDYAKWEMSESGKLKSYLLAERMTHYSDNGKTEMRKPLMYFYNEKTPPWVIKSATGVLSADGKNLHLFGKVNISRDKAEGVRPLTINTVNLRVNPETSYAETKMWAELISPPNKTTGTGMKMVYADPIHLELLSQVKGIYETK
jgi:lipopolysaccharide export system protein LptC